MIDAQAAGLAARVHAIADAVHSGPEWPERTLEAMGKLLVLCRAYRQTGLLDSDIGEDLRQAFGWNVRSEVWKELPIVEDVWSVLGKRIESEDRLRTERTWLAGRTTGEVVLHLQFAFGAQDFATPISNASDFVARVQYYPGRARQRVRIHTRDDADGPILARPPGFPHWDAFLIYGAMAIGRCPWTEMQAGVIQNVQLVPDSVAWQLVDSQGKSMTLARAALWDWLAISGGNPVDIAIEFDGRRIRPLGLWNGSEYLTASMEMI